MLFIFYFTVIHDHDTVLCGAIFYSDMRCKESTVLQIPIKDGGLCILLRPHLYMPVILSPCSGFLLKFKIACDNELLSMQAQQF